MYKLECVDLFSIFPLKRGGIKIDRKLKVILWGVYLRQVGIVAVFITTHTILIFIFMLFLDCLYEI